MIINVSIDFNIWEKVLFRFTFMLRGKLQKMVSSEIFFGNHPIQVMSNVFVQEKNRFPLQEKCFEFHHHKIIISPKKYVLEKNFLTDSRFLNFIRRAFISSQ